METQKEVEVCGQSSTNGRWGLRIVGPAGTKFPAEGKLERLGEIGGYSTYRFIPGETDRWVLIGEDMTPLEGAEGVERMSLQSNNYISLVILGPDAVVEHHGYKRRGSTVSRYVRGIKDKDSLIYD